MPYLTLFGYKIQIGISKVEAEPKTDVFGDDLSESELYIKKERELADARFAPKVEETTQMTTSETIRSWIPFIVVLCILLTSFLGMRYYLTKNYGGVVVDGESMTQTLKDGEKLLMKYYDGDVSRGDVIVVDVRDYKFEKTQFLIKRLIAVGGDKVKCIDGQVYVWEDWENNASGYEPIYEPYARYLLGEASYDFEEYVVADGEIFFLGDNRSYSIDSRYKQSNGSHLKNALYKETDIYGIVPKWAINNREFIEKIFFS